MGLIRALPVWFRNQHIQSKIFLVYIPLLIMPLFVLGYVSSSISTKAIVDKTIKNVSDNLNLILTRMDGMFTNAESCANMLTLNLNRILVDTAGSSKLSELQLLNEIDNQLRFALLVFPDVDSAAFVDERHQVYVSHYQLEQGAEAAIGSDLLKTIETTNGNNVWFPMQRRAFLVKDAKEPVLTLGKKVVNIQTGQSLGVLILNMKESDLSGIYQSIGSQGGNYFITDSGGIVVSSQKKQVLLQPVGDPALQKLLAAPKPNGGVVTVGGMRTLVVSADYPRFSWRLVTEVPLNVLTAENAKITQSILWIGLICLVFALLGARILSRLIASPLIRLAKAMRQFTEGSLDTELRVASSDETGRLAAGFNSMLHRIRELLADVRAEQLQRREFELALIQSQIKPHFLYNTLDVIYTLSELGRGKDVQRTTKALADFYRVALSGGREEITIEEEIRNVKDYLAIQRIRYSDVFDYSFDIDPAILQQPILKLTIQPLVENAIYHGLKMKGSFGHLTIRGSVEASIVMLQVADDGVGIPAERLKELLSHSDAEGGTGAGDASSGSKPFGLRNVDERIRLFFGDEFGLAIHSILGQGTTVTIKLPRRKLGEMTQL